MALTSVPMPTPASVFSGTLRLVLFRLVSRRIKVLVYEPRRGVGRSGCLAQGASDTPVAWSFRRLFLDYRCRTPSSSKHLPTPADLRGVGRRRGIGYRGPSRQLRRCLWISGSSTHSADGVPSSSTVIKSDSSHTHLSILMPPSGSLGMADTTLPTWGCLWDRDTSPGSSVSTTSIRSRPERSTGRRSGPQWLSNTSSCSSIVRRVCHRRCPGYWDRRPRTSARRRRSRSTSSVVIRSQSTCNGGGWRCPDR